MSASSFYCKVVHIPLVDTVERLELLNDLLRVDDIFLYSNGPDIHAIKVNRLCYSDNPDHDIFNTVLQIVDVLGFIPPIIYLNVGSWSASSISKDVHLSVVQALQPYMPMSDMKLEPTNTIVITSNHSASS